MQGSDFDTTQNLPKPQQTRSRIPRVAIVGTGFVGSTTACALLISGTAARSIWQQLCPEPNQVNS